MHVTLEPCPMCAGAILLAPVGKFVSGSPNSQEGADGSLHQEHFLILFLPDST
jgi:tRNA(Arg) A34 adenosine deaminase TadA